MNPKQEPDQGNPVSLENAAKDAVRKIKRNTRGLLLYFLPLPLLPALFVSLLRGEAKLAVANLGALFLLLLGAGLNRRGLANEREYEEQAKAKAPWPPWKMIGGVCIGAGVGIISWMSVGNGLFFSLIIALLALLGLFLSYDLDPLRDKGMVVRSSGFGDSEIGRILAEAEAKIAAIETASAQLGNQALRSRLGRITAIGRNILSELERDPDDLRLARKFLTVYLDSTRKVTEGYATTMNRANSNELEHRFSTVLVTIEEVFGEQHKKMLANDVLDLDVQMEVLEKRLRQEGI